MITIPGFVIYGPPRTKKNHGRIITLPAKGQRRTICHTCKRPHGRPVLLPSEQYEKWEHGALAQCPGIKAQLATRGVVLPLAGLLSIEALVYREANQGDANGYTQAIGDMLQKAGIIVNDVQIEDWDGTRRLKDPDRPRVEIYITVVVDRAIQEDLPLAE